MIAVERQNYFNCHLEMSLCLEKKNNVLKILNAQNVFNKFSLKTNFI